MGRLTGAAALAAVALLGLTSPALAHTDTGEFSAVQAEPTPGGAPGAYTIDVFLEYTNDGHGAEGAEITVTAAREGEPPASVVMSPGDRPGAYTGDIAFLEGGTYTITATSPDPVAERTFTVDVPEPTTTTTAAAPTTTETPTTTTEADDEDGGGASAVPWIIGALVLVGVGVGIGIVAWRRTPRSDS